MTLTDINVMHMQILNGNTSNHLFRHVNNPNNNNKKEPKEYVCDLLKQANILKCDTRTDGQTMEKCFSSVNLLMQVTQEVCKCL